MEQKKQARQAALQKCSQDVPVQKRKQQAKKALYINRI
jgi:hypothetical protein